MADGGHFGFSHQDSGRYQNSKITITECLSCQRWEKRHLICHSSSSGARDMKICDFLRWRMAAMLDLAIRNIPNVENNHLGVFVMPILLKNDTLFVFLSHLGPYDFQDGGWRPSWI